MVVVPGNASVVVSCARVGVTVGALTICVLNEQLWIEYYPKANKGG